MVSIKSLESILGTKFFYDDEEAGIGWDIEVFQIYKSVEDCSTYLIITDDIRVKLSYGDLLFGIQTVLNKIFKTYKEALNNG